MVLLAKTTLLYKNHANEKEFNLNEKDHPTKEDQTELIADSFPSFSQEYDPLQTEDINIPSINTSYKPIINLRTVENHWSQIKKEINQWQKMTYPI